jgi:hypothetical protein
MLRAELHEHEQPSSVNWYKDGINNIRDCVTIELICKASDVKIIDNQLS